MQAVLECFEELIICSTFGPLLFLIHPNHPHSTKFLPRQDKITQIHMAHDNNIHHSLFGGKKLLDNFLCTRYTGIYKIMMNNTVYNYTKS